MTYKDTILADGPILYTTFDEAGSTVADSSTAARTVTASGGPVKTTGISGTALSFDGVDDSVSAVAVTDHTSGSFTWECWFKSTQTTNTGHFIRRDGGGAAYLLRLNTGKVEFYANNGAGTVLSSTVKADGQWHHVAGVKNGTATTLYIDGVSVATGTATSASTGNTNIYLGSAGGTGEFYNGTLDEVAVYNKVLTGAQIQAHFNARIVPDTTTVAPAISVSLDAPAPVVTAVDITAAQTLAATADRRMGSGDTGNEASSLIVANAGTWYDLVFKFATPNIPVGYMVSSAVLTLTRADANTNIIPIHVAVPNGTWTESTTSNIAYTDVSTSLNIPTGSANTSFSIDVTDAYNAGGVDRGIIVGATSTVNDGLAIWMRESSTAAYRPTLTVTVAEQPQVPAVTQAPVMTLNLVMPQHRVGTDTTSIVIGTAEMSLSAPDAIVSVTSNTAVQALPMEMSMDFAGGKTINPDFTIAAPFMEMWIFAPDVNQYISVDNVIPVTGTMDFTVDGTADTQVSLQTDRTIFVQAMTMSIKTPGGYREGVEDRYRTMVPTTIDADDIWFKMNESAGTTLKDYSVDFLGGVNDATALLIGGPTIMSDGPRNRRAVEFDGVDDYVLVNKVYPIAFSQMDLTLEFSIKTTSLNGTVIDGGGSAGTYGGGALGENFAGKMLESEVRLINGELALYLGDGGVIYKIRKFVADNEWHHVVISIPSSTVSISNAYNIGSTPLFFANIDGETVWARHGMAIWGRGFIPSALMARSTYVGGDFYAPESRVTSNHIAGSLSDIVVRYNYAVSKNTAEKLYYEWSETLLVDPEPIVLSLTTPAPFRAKGNMKRMIALYGLPHYLYADDLVPYTRDGFGTYFSVFAGYYIENEGFYAPLGPGGSPVHINRHSNPIRMNFLPVKPFKLEGYMVYPVAIASTPGSSGTMSAPGMENGEYRDPHTQEFMDDRTGLPRFVDLDKDLVEDVTDFDAITAVNYPAVLPWDGPENTQNDPLQEFRQHGLGLTNNQWQTARDRLRDSILSASYRGVSLWINEPHMAEHLGFIQAWDKHSVGDAFEFFGDGNIEPTGYTNNRAYALDGEHLNPLIPRGQWTNGPGVGQFPFTWQADSKRVIVSTEPGLTDLPGWEKTDQISYYSDNAWLPHARVLAFDVIDRMAGLQIGDQVLMDMSEAGSYTGNYPVFNGWSVGVPRQYIVSAKPEGIVGKPISKELDFFYGAHGAIVPNRYKDNVYTIAAERGSVVRGRPIAGRAFMEFMDPDMTRVKIPTDVHTDHWNGEPNKNASTWSFDSRRYREIVIVWIIEKMTIRGDSITSVHDEQRYVDIQDRDWIYHPFISMNARGLHWLAETDDIPAGDVKTYVPSMGLSLETAGATVVKTRNVTSTVVGAMRLDLDLVEPASVDNPDASVKALPITLSLEMRGIGKELKVEPIALTLTAPDPVVTGSGDRITVYMDAVREITLFMKED